MTLLWPLLLWLTRRTPAQRATYHAYLRSAAWRKRSDAALYAAGHCCQACGRRRATQAHHTHYGRVGRERPRDLLAVCDACHRSIHSKR